MASPSPPRDEDTAVVPAEDTARVRALAAEPAPPPDAGPPAPAPPPPRLVENPWPWLLLVAVVAGGILVWLFLVRGSDEQTVPRVVGLRQQAAIERLNDAGYDVTAVRTPSKAPGGRVFAQKPGAGSRLETDQTVVISVSNGTPPTSGAAGPKAKPKPKRPPTAAGTPEVAMPDLAGRPLPDAGGELEAAGLVADSEPVDSEEPPGTVVAQEPGAGTKVAAGDTVHLQVARGGGSVATPDVTGLGAAQARAKLWAAKLTVRTTYRSGRAGIVLGQGTTGQAPAYDQVTISVGR